MKRNIIWFLMAMCIGVAQSIAQDLPKMPLDPQVRYGTLPNGLTYYIRHNEKPKGQADFYIAQKVGSILEEDNQRGLAHFLEHMCFNGTDNFPGNSLISWLESNGVKFGANLNAYTSIDETVYNISNVPIAREGVVDSVLLILHDWADGLTLDPAEIDKERGVIHEEWRRSMVGQMRILEKLLPTIYPDSKYGYRLPIGTIEVIDNFKPQEIRDYYETWYRPDQQGIIVVGDIDVDQIESKIAKTFSTIKMPETVKERVYFPVPDTKGTIYAIGSDKELSNPVIELMIKQDALPDALKGTQAELASNFLTYVIDYVINERLNDIASQPDAPFAAASASYGNFLLAKTKDALEISALPKGNDIPAALSAIYRELLRAAKGGITQSEYERAKAEYMSTLETAYNDRANVESGKYVREYVRHFIDGEAAPGIESEWQFAQFMVPQLPLAAINGTLKEMVTADNRIVMVLVPEAEGYTVPTEQQLADAMAAVDKEDIQPYVDQSREDPFVNNLPAPGKIVSTKQLPQWDATEWTLENGAKVIIKPTKFKDDQIVMKAFAPGGYASMPAAQAANLIVMPYAMDKLGFGDYTASDTEKYLSGKKISFDPSISAYSRELTGSSTTKDLPVLMELIYNTFTCPSIDAKEYESLIQTLKAMLANQEATPNYQFSELVTKSLYDDPRRGMITTEIAEAASREAILDILHSMTADAADYTFAFVGNVNMDEMKELAEKYLAVLPSAQSQSKKAPITDVPSLDITKGAATIIDQMEMQTPQTFVAIVASGDIPCTLRDRALASIAGQILSKRLISIVREEMGAVYSISASGSLSPFGKSNAVIQSAFPMKPEMKDEVLAHIAGQFDDMQSNITQEEFSNVIEFMIKAAKEALERNEPWLEAIILGESLPGIDINGMVDVYKSLTPDDVKDFMKQLMDQNNYRVVVLDPKQ